jgi:hypothetical protein
LRFGCEAIIETLTPFFKTWGHGPRGCLSHRVSLDVKCLSVKDYTLI